jgi:formyl-CoA transferase/succinyl-CoA--D-citramalate CoA-transferase
VQALRELVGTADVVIENFRPGTLERWGVGPDHLHELNPRLVVARVSGFGQTGPYRDRAGYGSVGEAMGGLRHLSGEPGRPPVRVGLSIGDALAGTHAFAGALMALYCRDRPGGSGAGQTIDVALYEAVWMYLESCLPEFQKFGVVRQPSGALLPGIAPSSVYPTVDGDWLIIGANQDSVFTRFALLTGHPEWVEPGAPYSTHEGRGDRQTELDSEIAEWTSKCAAEDLLTLLAEAGVPAGRIYTVADIASDRHYQARDMILTVAEPNLGGEEVAMPGVVPKLSSSPGRVTRGAPHLGEHNAEVWSALLGGDRLTELQDAGVI